MPIHIKQERYGWCYITYRLTRAGPLLGAERAGQGGCLNPPPRLTRLMSHVATRGKRHSKERQKS